MHISDEVSRSTRPTPSTLWAGKRRIRLALFMPFIVVAVMAATILRFNAERVELLLFLVGSLIGVAIFPLLFVVYREKCLEEYRHSLVTSDPMQIVEIAGLSWENYAVPISLLVTIILVHVGTFLAWDMYVGAGVGGGIMYLAHASKMPSAVVYWGFFGALIYIFQEMIIRFVSRDISTRFYFLSIVRILLADSAAILIFSVIQATYPLYDFTDGISPRNARIVYWLVPVCFSAGLFPVKTIRYVMRSTNRWLATLELLGEVKRENRSLPLSWVDGINDRVENRLHEEGIYTVQNLAMAELAVLIEKTPFGLKSLIDWQDQAMLLTCVGKENVEPGKGNAATVLSALHRNGLLRFSDLYFLAGDHFDTQTVERIASEIGSPGLLRMLMLRGEMIRNEVEKDGECLIQAAAFEVWSMDHNTMRRILKR